MDPRKFLKRLATELGLMKNNSNTQKKRERVSEPANFEHRVHVALDEDSGRFVGLPPQWKQVVGKKSDDVSSSEVSHAASRRFLPQRNRVMLDDSALDHTLSRSNTGNFTSFAASLETPRSRASVADNQDLIIERLKRELRDYKARNPHGFEELREDGLLSDQRYMTQNLRSVSRRQFSPLNKTNPNDTFPRFLRNSHRFDELAEEDFVANESNSKNYGNSALSSKSLYSPTISGNSNGLSSIKRNGVKSENHQRVLRRSESDV